MTWITLAYIGNEGGGVIHQGTAGADFLHPGKSYSFDFRPRGKEVTISNPPEDEATVERYKQLCLLNPGEWQLIDSG